ncbi:MAG: hypothetical protein HDS68_00390 [Bacteroidales bacterium]|nr:hypothetical protein [Bacteroidales bacterium]
MKIIAVERRSDEQTSRLHEAVATDAQPAPDCLQSSLLADSAVVRTGTPLFLPDFASTWMLEIVPAVVIDRLGKWIEPRFSSRYYSEALLAARLLPPEGCPEGGFAMSFDGAFAPGPHLPFPESGDFAICVDGKDEFSLSSDVLCIDDTVALVSRFMMLKTGDIIIPCRTPLRMSVAPGMRIHATLNGADALDLKIR